MKLNYPIVKEWALIRGENTNPFMAPELIPPRLHGKVYNDAKFKDGCYIATSSVQRMVEEQGVIIVETKNSKYIIRKEDVSEEYEKQMGNVWQRLITSINS